MSFSRYYLMTAKDGQVEDFRAALVGLAAKVKRLDGCEGVEVFQEADAQTRFHFIERWASIEAHKAGAPLLGKDAFAPIMAAIAGPPTSANLNPVKLD